MRWEAVYRDGTVVVEDSRPGGTYAALDRSRLAWFLVYANANPLVPVIRVKVEPEDTLVWRKVRQARIGQNPETTATFVALHHHNGTVSVWVTRPPFLAAEAFTSYDDAGVRPPVLLDHEVPS